MLWGNIGNRIGDAARRAREAAEDELAKAAGGVVAKVADNPTVKRTLDEVGARVAAPAQKKLTPTIVAIGVGVLVFGAILVWAATRKRSA